MWKERVVLEDEAHASMFRLYEHAAASDGQAVKLDCAGIRRFQACDEAEECCLAAAARANKRENIASLYVEANVVDRN